MLSEQRAEIQNLSRSTSAWELVDTKYPEEILTGCQTAGARLCV